MARQGLQVLAIDRAAYGTDTISTHALMRGGVLQLHRWGVLPRLRRAGTPAVRETTFHYGDETSRLPIRPRDGVDALYAPRRTLLDSMLVDAAREAGAEVRHGHTLVGLIRRPDGRVCGATCWIAEGNAIDDRRPTSSSAPMASAPAVARLAGAPTLRQARTRHRGRLRLLPGHRRPGYHWYYRPGVSAGVIPTNGGRHCVFAAMPPDASARRAGATTAGRLTMRCCARSRPDVGGGGCRAPSRTSRCGSLPAGTGSCARRMGPGWALVGDAGYFKDPLTAHGITDALRDAELLANAAAAGSRAAFADYAAIRDALSLPLFEVSDAIAAFDWDLDQLKVTAPDAQSGHEAGSRASPDACRCRSP